VAEPVITLHGVHALYGRTLALDIERLAIGPGERVFVLGRSGSGKTTLSRLVKGRLAPSTGSVQVLGCDPAAADPRRRRAIQRRIAMIDQEFFLVPRLTVVHNVLHGCLGRVPAWRSLIGWYPAPEWERAESILAEVDLGALGDRRVETLSGGQRQRAAIGRALMQEAEIILADEPVSALDPELAEDALGLLVDCVRRRGVTLVVNLHQPSLARKFASRLIGLAGGQVVYDGPPGGFGPQHAELVYRGNGKRSRPQQEPPDDSISADVAPKAGAPDLRLVRG
jgi:phosphonate transport system ATP-binding protein